MKPSSLHQVQKHQLPNGLTVLLEANSSSPVISLNLGVKIGSVWESEDEAGLSHLLEHMVFKGTKSYGPGEIATIVEASGGELNAYTSFDQTVYYINLSSRHALKGLNLLKEMVLDALIDPLELEREKEVVLEEISRGKDSPHRVLSEMIFSTAYKKHNYGRPVIGFDHTVKGFPPEKVMGFYKKWYKPNNMVLAICGDFDLETMKQAVESEFGNYGSGPISYPIVPTEPLPTNPRFAKKASNVQGNYFNLCFPIPNFKHEDTPAIDLLANLLGGGETSRLEQIVKEKKGLVASIHSSAYTPFFPGLFMVDAMIPEGKVDKAVDAILEEVEWCKTNAFDDETLKRAKLNLLSSLYYEKQTCEGTARKWLTYEMIAGDYRYEDTYLKALDEVTLHDMKIMAQKYLDARASITGVLHPEREKVKLKPRLPKPISRVLKKNYTLVDELHDIRKYRLSNGVVIVTKENNRIPLIALRQASLGGIRLETPRNNGISHLTMDMLEKGTKTKSALKIAELSETMAGHIEGSVGRNSWGLASTFLSDKKNIALELFTDMLLNPAFSKAEFAKERKQTLEAIKNQEDSLSHLAFMKFQSVLYPNHPYGMPIIGTAKSVRSLSQNQIAQFYKKILNPKNMVISAVGNFSSDDLVAQLADSLGHLKPTAFKLPRLKAEKKVRGIQKVEIKKDKMQAHIVLGFMGISLHNADRYAFEVLNNILSGQGGRLFLELRDKNSLAYTVTSMLIEGLEPGFFATYIGTDPSKIDQAIQGILGELRKITAEAVSVTELDRAKNFIVGNHELDLQRFSVVGANLAYNEIYGHGLKEYLGYADKILKVTAKEVLTVAQKYLDLESYVLSLIHPQAK